MQQSGGPGGKPPQHIYCPQCEYPRNRLQNYLHYGFQWVPLIDYKHVETLRPHERPPSLYLKCRECDFPTNEMPKWFAQYAKPMLYQVPSALEAILDPPKSTRNERQHAGGGGVALYNNQLTGGVSSPTQLTQQRQAGQPKAASPIRRPILKNPNQGVTNRSPTGSPNSNNLQSSLAAKPTTEQENQNRVLRYEEIDEDEVEYIKWIDATKYELRPHYIKSTTQQQQVHPTGQNQRQVFQKGYNATQGPSRSQQPNSAFINQPVQYSSTANQRTNLPTGVQPGAYPNRARFRENQAEANNRQGQPRMQPNRRQTNSNRPPIPQVDVQVDQYGNNDSDEQAQESEQVPFKQWNDPNDPDEYDDEEEEGDQGYQSEQETTSCYQTYAPTRNQTNISQGPSQQQRQPRNPQVQQRMAARGNYQLPGNNPFARINSA